MAAPIVWGVLVVGGIYGAGWAAGRADEALDSATSLTRWGVVAGGLYVSYRALQSSGALK